MIPAFDWTEHKIHCHRLLLLKTKIVSGHCGPRKTHKWKTHWYHIFWCTIYKPYKSGPSNKNMVLWENSHLIKQGVISKNLKISQWFVVPWSCFRTALTVVPSICVWEISEHLWNLGAIWSILSFFWIFCSQNQRYSHPWLSWCFDHISHNIHAWHCYFIDHTRQPNAGKYTGAMDGIGMELWDGFPHFCIWWLLRIEWNRLRRSILQEHQRRLWWCHGGWRSGQGCYLQYIRV